MSHTQDLMRQITAKADIRDTAYALHQHMGLKYGWSRSTAYNYWRGTSSPSDKHCIQIADELGQRPAPIASRTPSGAQCARGA